MHCLGLVIFRVHPCDTGGFFLPFQICGTKVPYQPGRDYEGENSGKTLHCHLVGLVLRRVVVGVEGLELGGFLRQMGGFTTWTLLLGLLAACFVLFFQWNILGIDSLNFCLFVVVFFFWSPNSSTKVVAFNFFRWRLIRLSSPWAIEDASFEPRLPNWGHPKQRTPAEK